MQIQDKILKIQNDCHEIIKYKVENSIYYVDNSS